MRNSLWSKQRLAIAYERDWKGTHLRIVSFAAKLKKQYPDCRRYRLYHALVGSTPSQTHNRNDFPNGEVAKFVATL